jgi:predicted tellurium resistance membrane protein TerC
LRIGLLLLISFILRLEKDVFTIFEQGFSRKDLVLIAGGLFLMYKSTSEIYHKMEVVKGSETKTTTTTSFGRVIVQILMMDLVFSIDSVITAIGMVKEV